MAVCRVEKNKYYTTMSNYHLRDPNLSNKARGLLSTMLSLPDNWDYTTRGLARICKDGVDGITAQLKELEQYGYLVRHRIRDSTGRITDMEYIIYERPHTASPDTEKPYMVKPDMALPRLETPAQINIDKRITEEINTDSVNTHSILSDGSRPSVLAALEAKRKEVSVRDMDEYREIIMENIDYDILRMDMPYDHDRLEEILELIVETVCSNKKYIRVAGTDYPAEVVRSRLLKLDSEHIKFVFSCLQENTTKIRNIKQYLLTTLYNAPTMSEEQLSMYATYMATLGNRPDLFPDSQYVGMYIDTEYEDYEIPAEALSDPQFAAMMEEAEKYLGYPYVWGGSSPSTSFDCSGFVSWVINNCGEGWSIGRLGAEGLRNTCSYVSPVNARPGDLIFFEGTYDTSGASHVGIYVGNNMMIHCGDPIQYASINTNYWQQHFLSFGRLPSP